ncbi:MAG: glycosyltransferase family 39 protein [Bryobacterales bacterium]
MSTVARATKPRKERKKAAQAPGGRSWISALGELLLPESPRARGILAAILLLAFVLRYTRLMGMFPILVDESIYLRWAQIIQQQGQWFISLLDGKPPLSYWLLALPRFVSAGDPLWQARLLSVIAGGFSTLGIFAVARRIAPAGQGDSAGLAAAALYAVFPWAILYDRLAYTEAYVNLFGLAIALASIVCFEQSGKSWARELGPGLALGLGLFTKQTALLFAAIPAAAAFYYGRRHERNWIARLAAIYAIAGVFLIANFVLTPAAPMLATHDAVLHHTGFFANPAELMADPFVAARSNFPKLASYIGSYMTWPLAAAALAGAVWLGLQGSFAPWLLVAGSLLPAIAEGFLLELMFPTRYPFPLFWPWLVAAAVAATAFCRQRLPAKPWAPAAAVAVLALAPLYRDVQMIASPETALHAADIEGFLGDHPHVGYGIAEAIAFLDNEAKTHGPFLLLSDPIWGPPADALFPYLNGRDGIQVYEAWWTQLAPNYAILPAGKAEVLYSHYDREKAGELDFSRIPRVFYVTDTHYYPREAVQVRQPGARLVASFPKKNGHSIDVYQLK